MTSTRPPAVAGRFYPHGREALRSQVEAFLGAAEKRSIAGEKVAAKKAAGDRAVQGRNSADSRPKALIAPHAGYVYSGPVAASAYAALTSFGDSVRRVVLLGPAHQYPLRGLAAPSADAFETPLGSVEVDQDALSQALELDPVIRLDEAYEGEHSLEVHLPFLQVVLKEFKIVPLLVGDAAPEEVAEVLRLLWGGSETLVVVSSDLSHFLPYARATQVDTDTARAIEELRPEDLAYEQACGRVPVAGLLLQVREAKLQVRCVDLRNSGDTAGPRDRVVGYGSFVVF